MRGQPKPLVFISAANGRKVLKGDNVFCLRAFFTLGHNKFNLLTFFQTFETSAGDGAVVDENVRTFLLLNKAKTFAIVEPLNSSSCFI